MRKRFERLHLQSRVQVIHVVYFLIFALRQLTIMIPAMRNDKSRIIASNVRYGTTYGKGAGCNQSVMGTSARKY